FLNTQTSVGTFSFANATSLTVEDAPVAIVAADFDGDGNIDLATAHSSASFGSSEYGVDVLKGDGTGGFDSTNRVKVGVGTTNILTSLVAGKFDGDNKIDIAVGGSDGVAIIVNNTSGGNLSFTSPSGVAASGNVASLTGGQFDTGGTPD